MREEDLRQYIHLLEKTNKYLQGILDILYFDIEAAKDFPFIAKGQGEMRS
nr:MAG TPA: hypothetical protein [Caudoviricetes sp.]